MQAVTGIFSSRTDAERTAEMARSVGIPSDRITLLIPGGTEKESVPVVTAEQPGMGKAIGAVVGAAVAGSGGALVAAVIPGVGPIIASGLLGAAVLAAAGATAGAVAGQKLEDSMTEGLPEDEIFVYEDALRKGRSVVIALSDRGAAAQRLRELFAAEGAEAVDAAREQWWIGLRSAEQEHYSQSGRNFGDREKFYRLGFEAALHPRTRCKEPDQARAELKDIVEDLKRRYPNTEVAEPFSRGYERGRAYYQHLCDKASRAA